MVSSARVCSSRTATRANRIVSLSIETTKTTNNDGCHTLGEIYGRLSDVEAVLLDRNSELDDGERSVVKIRQ